MYFRNVSIKTKPKATLDSNLMRFKKKQLQHFRDYCIGNDTIVSSIRLLNCIIQTNERFAPFYGSHGFVNIVLKLGK